MAKKLFALTLALAAVLSLSACMGSTTVRTDEQSAEAAEHIENYLEKAGSYFNVPDSGVVIPNVKEGDDVLKVYIDMATAKEPLPEALVDSYVKSFKAYFETSGEASENDDALKNEAEDLIKSEMVIYMAAENFGCSTITAEEEKAKAEQLAAAYKTGVDAFYTEGGDNYVVKSAIREDRVREKLQSLLDSASK